MDTDSSFPRFKKFKEISGEIAKIYPFESFLEDDLNSIEKIGKAIDKYYRLSKKYYDKKIELPFFEGYCRKLELFREDYV